MPSEHHVAAGPGGQVADERSLDVDAIGHAFLFYPSGVTVGSPFTTFPAGYPAAGKSSSDEFLMGNDFGFNATNSPAWTGESFKHGRP